MVLPLDLERTNATASRTTTNTTPTSTAKILCHNAPALKGAATGADVATNVYGSVLTLNGPAISAVAVNGPVTFLGSRHESEQVPPQPYSKLKVRSYEPSSLLICSFGARGREPSRVSSIRSSSRPVSL